MAAPFAFLRAIACADASMACAGFTAGASAVGMTATRGAFARTAAACAVAHIASAVLKASCVQIAKGFTNRRKGWSDSDCMSFLLAGHRSKCYATLRTARSLLFQEVGQSLECAMSRRFLFGRLSRLVELRILHARVLVLVAIHAQQLPVAAVGRIVVVVAVLMVHGELAQSLAAELARAAAADPRQDLERLLAVGARALLLGFPRLGDDVIELGHDPTIGHAVHALPCDGIGAGAPKCGSSSACTPSLTSAPR